MTMITAKALFSHNDNEVRHFVVENDINVFFTRAPDNKYSPRVRVKEIIRDGLDYAIVIPMNEKDGRQLIHIKHDSLEIVFN